MYKVRIFRECNKSFKSIFHFFDVTMATFFQFKSETAFRLKINLSRKSKIARLAPVEVIKLAKQAKLQEYRKNINASAG